MSELGGGVAGGGPLKSVVVSITATQLKNLTANPITLITGVANSAIIVRQITMNLLAGGVAFANLGSFDVVWKGGFDVAVAIANMTQATLFGGAVNGFLIALTGATGFFWNDVSSKIAGSDVQLKQHAGGDMTNGTGTVVITVEYEVIPVS